MVDGVIIRTPAVNVGPENEIKLEGRKVNIHSLSEFLLQGLTPCCRFHEHPSRRYGTFAFFPMCKQYVNR